MAKSRRGISGRSSDSRRIPQMMSAMLPQDSRSGGMSRRMIATLIRRAVPLEEDDASLSSIESTVGYYLSMYKGTVFTHVARGRWALNKSSTNTRLTIEDEDLATVTSITQGVENGSLEGRLGSLAYHQSGPPLPDPRNVEDVVMASHPHASPSTSAIPSHSSSPTTAYSQLDRLSVPPTTLGGYGWNPHLDARHADPSMLSNTFSQTMSLDELVTGNHSTFLQDVAHPPSANQSWSTYPSSLGSYTPPQPISQNASFLRSHGHYLGLSLEVGSPTTGIPACLDQRSTVIYGSSSGGDASRLGTAGRHLASFPYGRVEFLRSRPAESLRDVNALDEAPGSSSPDSYASSPIPLHHSGSSWSSQGDSY